VPVVDITVWIVPYTGLISCMVSAEDCFRFETIAKAVTTRKAIATLMMIILFLFRMV